MYSTKRFHKFQHYTHDKKSTVQTFMSEVKGAKEKVDPIKIDDPAHPYQKFVKTDKPHNNGRHFGKQIATTCTKRYPQGFFGTQGPKGADGKPTDIYFKYDMNDGLYSRNLPQKYDLASKTWQPEVKPKAEGSKWKPLYKNQTCGFGSSDREERGTATGDILASNRLTAKINQFEDSTQERPASAGVTQDMLTTMYDRIHSKPEEWQKRREEMKANHHLTCKEGRYQTSASSYGGWH